ncbi:hypothetical protein PY254_10430 [Rhodanobacter sp. AS-Z3]|uniref:hypothetical protein n=1 Tax=Rhodanobacter sp. AS-Z3 TaxID=3031330 RepID=UPI00247964B6|nr:hypothetical protein [Rhodanobacter sp. AS-Z3]WEN13662.1 hypothetical protein PY254_10430 [Rhodanobacter sp. AS-Z3]
MKDERATSIELIRDDYGDLVHPYPWRFAITHKGVRHEFCGMPNKCATPGAALSRATKRMKWLEDGTYAERYK